MRHYMQNMLGRFCDTESNLLGTHTLVRTCPHAAGSLHGDDDDGDYGDDGFLRELQRQQLFCCWPSAGGTYGNSFYSIEANNQKRPKSQLLGSKLSSNA